MKFASLYKTVNNKKDILYNRIKWRIQQSLKYPSVKIRNGLASSFQKKLQAEKMLSSSICLLYTPLKAPKPPSTGTTIPVT